MMDYNILRGNIFRQNINQKQLHLRYEVPS